MKKLFALIALASGAVSAQTNLDFNATVSTSCSLNVTQSGIMTIDPQFPGVLTTNASGGRSGAVGVAYVGTPTVTVTIPQSFFGSPTLTFTPTFSGIIISNTFGTMPQTNFVASDTYASGNSDQINVSLESVAGGSNAFPQGSYNAQVTVSCV